MPSRVPGASAARCSLARAGRRGPVRRVVGDRGRGGARGSRARRPRGARWTSRRARGAGSGARRGPVVSTSGPPRGRRPAGRRRPGRRGCRAARAVADGSSPGVGSAPPRREVAVDRGLQRALDDLLGVRVVAQVARDRVDRLLVAVRRVEAVDAPVVEPVREDLVPAGRGRCGRGRQRERDDERREQREARRPSAGGRRWRRGGSVSQVRPGGSAVGRVFRLPVISCVRQGKRFVRRTSSYPCAGAGKRRGRW